MGFCSASVNFMCVRYDIMLRSYRRYAEITHRERYFDILVKCTITQKMNFKLLITVR